MLFVVQILSEEDMRETAVVRLDAFDGAPAQLALRPQGTTPATIDWYTKKHLNDSHEPGMYFVGVRDTTTGTLAAYAEWQRDTAADRAAAAHKVRNENLESPYSPGSNAAAQKYFWDLLEKSERDYMGETDYWHLHLLATRPNYQGKGAAKMVMRWGQERAKADGIPCYLDATEAGRPLYTRVGFVEGPEWNVDLKQWGVEHWNRQWPMRWDAGGET